MCVQVWGGSYSSARLAVYCEVLWSRGSEGPNPLQAVRKEVAAIPICSACRLETPVESSCIKKSIMFHGNIVWCTWHPPFWRTCRDPSTPVICDSCCSMSSQICWAIGGEVLGPSGLQFHLSTRRNKGLLCNAGCVWTKTIFLSKGFLLFGKERSIKGPPPSSSLANYMSKRNN